MIFCRYEQIHKQAEVHQNDYLGSSCQKHKLSISFLTLERQAFHPQPILAAYISTRGRTSSTGKSRFFSLSLFSQDFCNVANPMNEPEYKKQYKRRQNTKICTSGEIHSNRV